MGQQQLLLLVVGVIIVAVAVVVGINQFGQATDQGTIDNIVQAQKHIGTQVLAQANKPNEYGGGTYNFDAPAKMLEVGNILMTDTPTDSMYTVQAVYAGKTIMTVINSSGITTTGL